MAQTSIVEEKLLAERVYFGAHTHIYVTYLRAYKLGLLENIKINKLTDIVQRLHKEGLLTKEVGGEKKPLAISTINTELEKVWAVIKQEDTDLIDPYGYDVNIIQ